MIIQGSKSLSALPSVVHVLQVRDRGSWFGVHEDVPRYRKSVISPSMFPSGKGSKDSEVNTDVIDADMKDSTDMGEGNQETHTAINDSNNGDNLKTEIDCESGEAPARNKKLNFTSSRTEHSDYPLHHCMRIVPHDQNSGAFFIAVLHKLSPLNGNVLSHSLILHICFLVHQVSYASL